MDRLIEDLRFGFRSLKRTPGFTITTLVLLALGICATTSIFTVVSAVLLRPLPYDESDRIVMLWETNPRFQIGIDTLPVTPGGFMDWREQNTCFEEIAAFGAGQVNLTGSGEPERISCASVSPDFFDLFRASVQAGRSFNARDEQPGAEPVVVISHALWQRRFGGDSAIIGRLITLDGKGYVIAGIASPGFQFPRVGELPSFLGLTANTDIWKPMALSSDFVNRVRANHQLCVIARLKSGVEFDQAKTEMNTLASRLEQASHENQGIGVRVVRLDAQITGRVRTVLLVLFGATLLVLLIACVNVANLLVSRAATRRREIAIRFAIGATRVRIIRQLLTEALMLALAGGVAGALASLLIVRTLVAFAGNSLPRAYEVNADWRVLSFALLISLASCLICGILPALRASRTDLTPALKEGSAASAGTGPARLRSALVVLEIALSMVLLVGSGLLFRSLATLLNVDPGFRAEKRITARISLPPSSYSDQVRQINFFNQAEQRLGAIPGIESAALISSAPLGGGVYAGGFSIEGRDESQSSQTQTADRRMVGPRYFETLGIPLIEGRDFAEGDVATSSGVAIISEGFARSFFPQSEPIGKRLKLGGRDSTRPWLSIIGVVGDVRDAALESIPRPCIYLPYTQFASSSMTMVVRSTTEPAAIVSGIRQEIWAIDKDLPITDIKSMTQYLSESASTRRIDAFALGIFAGLALVLASIGVYGVVAYSVAQRTKELGIRVALGARSGDLVRLILLRGLAIAIVGSVIGLIGAAALGRVISSLLYEVSATDPLTLALVTVLMILTAGLAGYLPARRAATVDPVSALRSE